MHESKTLLATCMGLAFLAAIVVAPAFAESEPSNEGGGDEAAELAKKLQNPVAALISVPFQNNFEWAAGRSAKPSNTLSTFSPSSRSRSRKIGT